jgi:hypothetical protein
MKKVEDYERVRKAYHTEGLSIRENSRQYGHVWKAPPIRYNYLSLVNKKMRRCRMKEITFEI